jgi:hypothetical protein
MDKNTLMRPSRNLVVIFLVAAITTNAVAAQNAPRVIAWQAPTGPGVSPPSAGCIANYTSGYWSSFTSVVLPKISGIGVVVYWDCVDDCSAMLARWNAPCATPAALTCPTRMWDGNWEDCFDWPWLDAALQDYTIGANPLFKVVLIINAETDSGEINGVTPPYVFTTPWATTVGAVNPQDVVVCQDWQGGTQGGVPSPVSGPFGSSGFGIWNTNSCAKLGSATCATCTGPCGFTNFSGFPVVYEKPILNAYQNFLLALFKHYSSQGSATGQQIAPYILYARIGMSHGGENYPICATQGPLLSCNNPPCNNGGSNSTWPGPQGQFPPSTEGWTGGLAYSDAGYLTEWPTSGDGRGYITTMLQFLNAKATFPVTIASSYGPPGKSTQFYADVEAQLAAQNSVGFGNQTLKIYDTIAAAAGEPSVDNWVANFRNYPYAPVHHLQTNSPGNGSPLASGFAISPYYITYSGGTTATVSCAPGSGCNTFCPGFIYITGNDSPLLNGVFPTVPASMCAADTVTFTLTQFPPNGTYNNGIMWGPNYWPIIMPFATQQKATSVEVWECDVDFAFGTTTTTGCGNTLTSPNSDYENAVSNTLVGIPFGTSFHIASFYNGWQF